MKQHFRTRKKYSQRDALNLVLISNNYYIITFLNFAFYTRAASRLASSGLEAWGRTSRGRGQDPRGRGRDQDPRGRFQDPRGRGQVFWPRGLTSLASTISSLLHSCPGLATYWRMCKCCVTYLLTYGNLKLDNIFFCEQLQLWLEELLVLSSCSW